MRKFFERNKIEIGKLKPKSAFDRLIKRTESQFPLVNEDPKYAIQKSIKYVRKFSRFYRIRVYEFKTGRTANPESRKNQKINGKKPDAWIMLYISDNFDHVKEVEATLNERFYLNPKCANKDPTAGGGTSQKEVSCVYLAVINE